MKTLKKVTTKWLSENWEDYYFSYHYYDYSRGIYNYYFKQKPSVFVNSKPVFVFVQTKKFNCKLLML